MIKGEIILVNFPFTDLTGSKLRPALVLAEKRDDILIAFITSHIEILDEDDILLKTDKNNKLKKDSKLRLFRLATLKKGLAVGKIGSLDSETLNSVDNKLIKILKIKS